MKGTKPGPIVLANWGRRFVAWFVDYLIINVLLAYFNIEQLETLLIPSQLLPRLPGFDVSIWSPLSVLVFFLYWTFSEWYFGRSIGQLLLNLRLADSKGRGVSLKASAIQSVGKSLLLPLDCLIGWVYRPCKQMRQRFFNRLSNTIVIFIGKPTQVIRQGEYEKEP
jgi:hypothetical protein